MQVGTVFEDCSENADDRPASGKLGTHRQTQMISYLSIDINFQVRCEEEAM